MRQGIHKVSKTKPRKPPKLQQKNPRQFELCTGSTSTLRFPIETSMVVKVVAWLLHALFWKYYTTLGSLKYWIFLAVPHHTQKTISGFIVSASSYVVLEIIFNTKILYCSNIVTKVNVRIVYHTQFYIHTISGNRQTF